MIPKRIFQTYKVSFDELSENAKKLIQLTKDNNPGYEYNYYSDQDVEGFIIKYFGNEWYKRYLSLEYPVMKADVFRILVIYMFGGFYADLDMKSIRPIDSLNNENTLACFGIHDQYLMMHPFFGFTEKHPLIEYLVNSLAESIDSNKLENFYDPDYMVHHKHYKSFMHNRDNLIVRYVMDVTGPLWFAESILKYFGIKNTTNLINIYKGRIPIPFRKSMFKQGVTLFMDNSPTAVYKNLLGSSSNFYGDGYESWYGAY